MQKVFVDANVIAEMLFKRTHDATSRNRLSSNNHWLFISALTVHIIYYLAEKDRLDPTVTRTALEPYLIVPIDQRVVELAQTRFTGHDFEDCLQAAAAELAGCEHILTLDRDFAKLSRTTLPVELIA